MFGYHEIKYSGERECRLKTLFVIKFTTPHSITLFGGKKKEACGVRVNGVTS